MKRRSTIEVYKLTDKNGFTRNNTKWGEGITHEVPELGQLCSNRCLHFYFHPFIAVLLNPVYGNIESPILWKAEAEKPIIKDYFKGGTKKLTTLRQIELPRYTRLQIGYFAILCAKEVYKDKEWNKWADDWIKGKNRKAVDARIAADAAAHAAADAADAAARAAAYAAARAAAYAAARAAAYAAAYAAADAAADAAYAADAAAADAADAAADAAAHAAADAAAHAAADAADAAASKNFSRFELIAKEAHKWNENINNL